MTQLTAEETAILAKSAADITYVDHRLLISAIGKFRRTGNQRDLFAAQLRLALALERSRVPHDEKARHWEAAALLAESHETPRAELFARAASHFARDGAPFRAAQLFEKAADHAITEKLDRARVQGLLREGRTLFDLSGHGSDAARLFKRENDYVRKVAPWPTRAWMWVFQVVSAYGESPGRVALVALILIVACAGVYTGTGLQSSTSDTPIHSFASSLYFSVVTFTTLGYGDISPLNGIARLVVMFEAILGVFLMSLLLVTLVRRYGRG